MNQRRNAVAFLPVTRKEMEERGWDQCDFGDKTLFLNIPDKNNACAEEAYTCGDTGGNT